MTEQILHGNWNTYNRIRLEKLIKEKSFAGNYAVFDWDFTCIFYDIQDSFFIYQLENLLFYLSPEQFAKTIRAGIPQTTPFLKYKNIDGHNITAGYLCEDIDSDYKFLYNSFNGLNGSLSIEKIRDTDEFIDFKAKMIMLMRGAITISNIDIAQSVSTGLDIKTLNKICENTIDRGLNDKIQICSIKSPNCLRGKSGIIEVTYRKGLRIQKEMQELILCLNKNGIETYVCSASQEYPVRVFASNPKYGYCIKPENVLGRRRIFDSENKITDEHDISIPATRKEGKAEAIEKLIQPKHGGKAPVLIAGDSDGDFYMMDKFKNESLILIFNRNQSKDTKIYSLLTQGLNERKFPDTNIIVQDRNEEEGLFKRE